jgi:hypothetical protein
MYIVYRCVFNRIGLELYVSLIVVYDVNSELVNYS